MQGATTDDEPMGRNPGTSEAANLTALKVRGCDLAPRFADLIEASGHVPCFKAVHMNAPSTRVKSIEKLLAPRAVPHMRFCRNPVPPAVIPTAVTAAARHRQLFMEPRHRDGTTNDINAVPSISISSISTISSKTILFMCNNVSMTPLTTPKNQLFRHFVFSEGFNSKNPIK